MPQISNSHFVVTLKFDAVYSELFTMPWNKG